MGGIFIYSFLMDMMYPSSEYADSLEFSSKMLGATVAFVISWYLDDKYLDFKTGATWYVQIMKVVIGLGIIMLIKEGFKPIFEAMLLPQTISDFIRYFMIVIFAGYIWPLVFTKCVKRV